MLTQEYKNCECVVNSDYCRKATVIYIYIHIHMYRYDDRARTSDSRNVEERLHSDRLDMSYWIIIHYVI